jgi:hypothetical protein
MLLQTCCPDGAEGDFAHGDEGHRSQSTLSLHLTVLSNCSLTFLS